MRGSKTKLADKKKIIKAKLTNPEATLRGLEHQTGVPMKTVDRIIKEVPKFDTHGHMVASIDEILTDIMNITKKNIKKYDLKEELQTRELRDLSAIAKENRERKRIIQGEPTDIMKLDFNLEGKSIRELEELRKKILQSKA